jgi:DNA-binding NarL/FixJ family response regulator
VSGRNIRVLIAEDVMPIREYLYMVVGHEPDMEVVGRVGTGTEAVVAGFRDKPDVVLMDLEMETPRAGVDAIQAITARLPETRCIVLTHFSDDGTVYAAFEAGAVDYVLKNASVAEIVEAIRAAYQNLSPLRPQIARMIRTEFKALRMERSMLIDTLNVVYKLTPTELSLLRLLAEGKSKNEIATMRRVEASTIRTHVGNILKKFDEPSVTDVVTRLRRLGIFEIFLE